MEENKLSSTLNIPTEIIELLKNKKTDSISLSKTSAGKYSWDIKIYCDDLRNEDERNKVTETIEKINKKMEATFTNTS